MEQKTKYDEDKYELTIWIVRLKEAYEEHLKKRKRQKTEEVEWTT